MAGFAEIPFIEPGQHNGSPIPNFPPPLPGLKGGGGGGRPAYPHAKVGRALFGGDVIKVGPRSVTAYWRQDTARRRRAAAIQCETAAAITESLKFSCCEYPDDIGRNSDITEASVRTIWSCSVKCFRWIFTWRWGARLVGYVESAVGDDFGADSEAQDRQQAVSRTLKSFGPVLPAARSSSKRS